MNPLSIRTAAAALAAAATLSVGLAAPAFAATPTTRVERPVADLDAVRARCDAAIAERLTKLDQLTAQVNGAAHVSAAQKDTLLATIAATRNGLTGLRSEIAADTDKTELADDCRRIVDDYRVYVLLTPRVHLVIGADSAQSAVAALNSMVPKIDAAIAAAKATGIDTSAAESLLTDLKTKTAEADTLSASVLAAVSPLTPADYNAGTARPVLDHARADLAKAAADLVAARNDAREIARLLRA
jgi:hypothetical protein